MKTEHSIKEIVSNFKKMKLGNEGRIDLVRFQCDNKSKLLDETEALFETIGLVEPFSKEYFEARFKLEVIRSSFDEFKRIGYMIENDRLFYGTLSLAILALPVDDDKALALFTKEEIVSNAREYQSYILETYVKPESNEAIKLKTKLDEYQKNNS